MPEKITNLRRSPLSFSLIEVSTSCLSCFNFSFLQFLPGMHALWKLKYKLNKKCLYIVYKKYVIFLLHPITKNEHTCMQLRIHRLFHKFIICCKYHSCKHFPLRNKSFNSSYISKWALRYSYTYACWSNYLLDVASSGKLTFKQHM